VAFFLVAFFLVAFFLVAFFFFALAFAIRRLLSYDRMKTFLAYITCWYDITERAARADVSCLRPPCLCEESAKAIIPSLCRRNWSGFWALTERC
jgi:uncharacterized membrane protein YhaH (DUF805 family)